MKRWRAVLLTMALLLGVAGCTAENHAQTGTSNMESVLSPAESAGASSDDALSHTDASSVSTDPPEDTVPPKEEGDGPRIWLGKDVYAGGESITVYFADTDTKDWVGIYPYGVEPGPTPSLTWQYAVGEGTRSFPISLLKGAGEYWIFLCDNDGYVVLDMETITVSDGDTRDYGAKSLSVSVTKEQGYSHTEVTVTPSSDTEVTYSLYWSKDGKRLEGYMPIHTFTHKGSAPFTVSLNDCLFMPGEADGMEIAVAKGRSTSYFAEVSSELKLPSSKLLYSFAVLTDMHITSSKPVHISHLESALVDIKKNENPISTIFTVGDNTDTGSAQEYDLLMQIIKDAGELPPIYYAVGNHDVAYGYDERVQLFKDRTGMEGAYYSVELNGTRYIVLASEDASTSGLMHSKQVAWLKEELAKCDPNKPVFLFLHQPLKDTVSGTLSYINSGIQDWYGVLNAAKELRTILKEYPNAILFTGHTHWKLESLRPFLPGKGEDANFINCASVGYLWNDQDKAAGGSQGIYVEVYEDYILLRGREFLFGKWCAAAQFMIPIVEK